MSVTGLQSKVMSPVRLGLAGEQLAATMLPAHVPVTLFDPHKTERYAKTALMQRSGVRDAEFETQKWGW